MYQTILMDADVHKHAEEMCIRDRYQAHTALADGIFFAMLGVAALSWVVTLLRHLWNLLEGWQEERAMAKLLAYRVRQARAAGEYIIDTEGLW